jgi:integrase/recombinase XerD
LNAIKSVIYYCGNNPLDFSKFNKVKRIKRPAVRPKGIDKEFLLKQIEEIDNRKHKALIALAYSTGMKLYEMLDLKLEDIFWREKLILVRTHNPIYDRELKMSDNLKLILQRYIKKYNPKEYLFNGVKDIQYNKKSALCVVKEHIGKEYNFHHIRHASAYAYLEEGGSYRHIEKQFGIGFKISKNYKLDNEFEPKAPL